jgi:hypothetical protein
MMNGMLTVVRNIPHPPKPFYSLDKTQIHLIKCRSNKSMHLSRVFKFLQLSCTLALTTVVDRSRECFHFSSNMSACYVCSTFLPIYIIILRVMNEEAIVLGVHYLDCTTEYWSSFSQVKKT